MSGWAGLTYTVGFWPIFSRDSDCRQIKHRIKTIKLTWPVTGPLPRWRAVEMEASRMLVATWETAVTGVQVDYISNCSLQLLFL